MAEHDYVIDNASGSAVRSDINSVLSAIVTNNSKSTAPSTTFAFEFWVDTTANILKVRDGSNTAWVNMASLSGTTWIPYRSGTVLGDAAEKTVGTADANLPTNSNIKGTVREFTKQQNFNAALLTDGANIAWNLDDFQVARVALLGNRTLDNPTNLKDGAVYILKVIQGAGGSHTLSYDSAYKWPGGTAPVLSTTANDVDFLTFLCDGASMYGVFELDFS